ncbi:hypothetical protein C5U62_01025 [Pseudomonas protegens]|uniref:Uncharacterized protein n=1 Tax=Pseudomonas protegens TaxID=380021 RepID=A0A2T6GR12_9PSED|nr:hypothetical protein [Pseudomonas protegens]PUA46598.1 hypothetical protein C5U62_01025 [Pseudomonas protegens]
MIHGAVPVKSDAARNLLATLDSASGPQNLSQIRFAIGLLLSDGFDLLRTLGDRTLRQADPA